jgi:hypothetical protein
VEVKLIINKILGIILNNEAHFLIFGMVFIFSQNFQQFHKLGFLVVCWGARKTFAWLLLKILIASSHKRFFKILKSQLFFLYTSLSSCCIVATHPNLFF